MNIIWAAILLAGGLIILWKCAQLLIAGAVGFAERLSVSPLIIGLTIVAMGTSAPEVAASIAAVFRESGGDIAIGNVCGSNIANLALVGGLVALIRPIKIRKQTLLREIPVMLAVALLLWPVLHNLDLSRAEGYMLLGVFAALAVLTVYVARREARAKPEVAAQVSPDTAQEVKLKVATLRACLLSVIIGLAGLAAGAKMTVAGAVYIGRHLGLSEAVIGLTVIAIGTSLPELVTCVVAAIKKQDDISIGNLVGSNIFNTLLVTGAAGSVRPFAVGPRFAGGVDYWIMIAVSVAFTSVAIIGRRTIDRAAGVFLLCGYIAYMTYLLVYTGGA